MTKAELAAMVEAAGRAGGEAALKAFLDHLDVNWDDKAARVRLREDLNWLRTARARLDYVGGRTLLVIISIATGGFFIWAWRALAEAFKKAVH